MSAIPRNEGEAFKDYKARRLADHLYTQAVVKLGVVFHGYLDGTYKNPNRAVIKAERKARKEKRKQLKGTV